MGYAAATLLILAEWDQDTPPYMAQEVFSKLTNAPYRRLEVLSEGTHTVAVEKNRMHLVEQVQSFLEVLVTPDILLDAVHLRRLGAESR